MHKYIFTFVLIATSAISAEETAAQKIWAEAVYNKSADLVLQDLKVIEMIAFTGMEKSKISPMTAAIASTLVRTCGFDPLRGPLRLEGMLARATQIAGRKLTEPEIKNITALHDKAVRAYYTVNPPSNSNAMRMDITFGIGDIRSLNQTLAGSTHISEALLRITKLHGWGGQVHEHRGDSLPQLKEALDRGIPVLIESGQEIRVCFGYLRKEGQWSLLYALPKEMPLQLGDMPEAEEDKESLRWEIIADRKDDAIRFKGKFKADYQTSAAKQIPPIGFVIEPYEAGTFAAYVIMNWRSSAAAYDADLCKLLQLSEPATVTQSAPLPANPTDKDLWAYYIHNKEETLGGPSTLLPCHLIPAREHANPLYAALSSTICTQQGVELGKFSLNVNKLYKCACAIMNDEYLLPDGDKRARMDALVAKLQEQYNNKVNGVSAEVAKTADPYMAAGLRLEAAMSPAQTVPDCLKAIEQYVGWRAVTETKDNLSLDYYKKALFKRIPILLKPAAGNGWLVCIGYLRHNNEDYLLLADPQRIEKGAALQLDRQKDFPGSGVRFERFDASRYVPYFVHAWQISADPYRKEVEEIFRGSAIK